MPGGGGSPGGWGGGGPGVSRGCKGWSESRGGWVLGTGDGGGRGPGVGRGERHGQGPGGGWVGDGRVQEWVGRSGGV